MRGTVAYAAVSIVGIGVFAATRRYTWFAISQFVPYMILPFLLMWALGGPVNGSGVGLWAGLGPIVALLLGHLWQATLLVVLYVGLLVVTVLAPASAPAMSAPLLDLFFILNLAGVPIVTWLLVRVFAGGREGALASVRSVVRRYLPADLVTALEADPHRLDLGGQIAEVTLFSLGVNSTKSKFAVTEPGLKSEVPLRLIHVGSLVSGDDGAAQNARSANEPNDWLSAANANATPASA
ncbi:MAG: hypothetical protein ABIO99_11550, partial [Candidatus Limnocylindria bacterium]